MCTSRWMAATERQVIKTVCGVHGDLTPKCSATRMVDEWLLGFRHMYFPGAANFVYSKWCSGCSPRCGGTGRRGGYLRDFSIASLISLLKYV